VAITVAVVLAVVLAIIIFWIHRRGKKMIDAEAASSNGNGATPVEASQNSATASRQPEPEVGSEKR
jgi:hypothetical protein